VIGQASFRLGPAPHLAAFPVQSPPYGSGMGARSVDPGGQLAKDLGARSARWGSPLPSSPSRRLVGCTRRLRRLTERVGPAVHSTP